MLNTTIRKIFTVNFAVASLAECQTVRSVKAIIGKVCPLFNVMGVQVLFITAMLTSVFVAGEYGFTPSGNIGLLQFSLCLAFTAFPSWMLFTSRMQSISTGDATRFARLTLPRQERGRADNAVLSNARVAVTPTFARAEFRLVRTKAFDFIGRMADGASLLHRYIVAHSERISENYCAVILERMATAFPDIEIKKLENAKQAN